MKKVFLITIFILLPAFLFAGVIKPGVVITKENYKKYLSELKRLFPVSTKIWYIEIGLKNGIVTIPIVKTKYFTPSKGYMKATKKYKGKCKIGPKKELIGWIAGTPFPEPKNALELAWDAYPEISHGTSSDDTGLNPSWFGLYSNVRFEKYFIWNHFKKKYMGRTDNPPIPQMEEALTKGITSKESFVIVEPFDVKGFSQLRIRYWDIGKPDDAYAYIPALRRLRRLTGLDVCDPLLGSDAMNDDFEIWRQKLNPKMDFKILDTREFLVPKTYTKKIEGQLLRKQGPCFQVEWELRPLFVLEIKINDPDYIYSKRVLFIDKKEGNYTIYQGEFYDQRGRLWRACVYPSIADEFHRGTTGHRNIYGAVYMNCITRHFTPMDIWPEFIVYNPEKVFTIKGLLKRTH